MRLAQASTSQHGRLPPARSLRPYPACCNSASTILRRHCRFPMPASSLGRRVDRVRPTARSNSLAQPEHRSRRQRRLVRLSCQPSKGADNVSRRALRPPRPDVTLRSRHSFRRQAASVPPELGATRPSTPLVSPASPEIPVAIGKT